MFKFLRLWRTLRYLRSVQIYGRIWFRLSRPRVDLSPAPPLRLCHVNLQPPAQRQATLVAPADFFLLNESGSIAVHGWDDPAKPKLWRYNQHYFDDLNAIGATRRFDWHRELVFDWINSNPPGKGTGWEPYPTSLRIVNWVKWLSIGKHFSKPYLESLAIQTRWLSKRLEYHLLGNHLFANAKALIFAGSFFAGKEASVWLKTGLSIVENELPEQVLPDGGQFELSTMYHALAVEDMLDLLNILRRVISAPDEHSALLLNQVMTCVVEIEQRLPGMLRWLNVMRHPDGEIAFFNDAAFCIAPSCNELLEYAVRLNVNPLPVEPDTAIVLNESGYFRLSNAIATVHFDAAPIGPDYLPGHAHADTLSLELSLFCQRVFVNSGTSEYGISEERHRQRSTAAHNTLEISGENSSEIWSGFRVARRAYPSAKSCETRGKIQEASAWHSGYQRLSPPVLIGRSITLAPGYLVIEDQVEGSFRSAVSRFYCHPSVAVSQISSDTVRLQLEGGQIVHLVIDGDAELSVTQATWHPEFGLVQENQCIVIQVAAKKLITRLEWGLP
jgi:uncharacterized heparinase superfamily protein